MINTVLASVALLAGTALAQGSAIVINSCSYDVYLANTPSADGVHSTISETLPSGGSYSQVYTELANRNGWSLKLSQSASSTNILQYEYTYLPGQPIWFDLSEVNGNPWDGNWEITGSNGCTPRQAAYRYSTDDAYGMQSCDASASVTVTLCSGDSSGGAPSSPAESAAPTYSTPDTTATVAPTTTPTTTAVATPTYTHTYHRGGGFADKNVEGGAVDAPKHTTLVTSAKDTWTGPAVTVTNVAYETVTQVVTATAHAKRHEHHPRHPHHPRA